MRVFATATAFAAEDTASGVSAVREFVVEDTGVEASRCASPTTASELEVEDDAPPGAIAGSCPPVDETGSVGIPVDWPDDAVVELNAR